MNSVTFIFLVLYVAINTLVAIFYSTKSMKKDFIESQRLFGKICLNVFYAPAWLIKLAKAIVVAAIA